MNIGDVIRRARQAEGLTQEELAGLADISRITINKYENLDENNISYDQLLNICNALKSSKLRLQLLGFVLPVIYLNNINLSPLAVQFKTIEELKETIDTLQNLDLINKTEPEDLTNEEITELIDVLVDVQDLNIAINHFLAVIEDDFEIALDEIKEKSKKKMIKKGYLIED